MCMLSKIEPQKPSRGEEYKPFFSLSETHINLNIDSTALYLPRPTVGRTSVPLFYTHNPDLNTVSPLARWPALVVT